MTCYHSDHYQHKRGFKLIAKSGCSCNWYLIRHFAGGTVKIEKQTVNGRKKNANPTILTYYVEGQQQSQITEQKDLNNVDAWFKTIGLISQSVTLNIVA